MASQNGRGEQTDHDDQASRNNLVKARRPRRDESSRLDRQARRQNEAHRRVNRQAAEKPKVGEEREGTKYGRRPYTLTPNPGGKREHQSGPAHDHQSGRRVHPGEMAAGVVVPGVEAMTLQKENHQLDGAREDPEPGGPNEDPARAGRCRPCRGHGAPLLLSAHNHPWLRRCRIDLLVEQRRSLPSFAAESKRSWTVGSGTMTDDHLENLIPKRAALLFAEAPDGQQLVRRGRPPDAKFIERAVPENRIRRNTHLAGFACTPGREAPRAARHVLRCR